MENNMQINETFILGWRNLCIFKLPLEVRKFIICARFVFEAFNPKN